MCIDSIQSRENHFNQLLRETLVNLSKIKFVYIYNLTRSYISAVIDSADFFVHRLCVMVMAVCT